MKKKKITNAEIARETGVNPVNVSQRLNGHIRIRYHFADVLSRKTNIPIQDIILASALAVDQVNLADVSGKTPKK